VSGEANFVTPMALEQLKVSCVATLVGYLTVGPQWTCPQEEKLLAASLQYLMTVGSSKASALQGSTGNA
jgi:hypothetical protein